MLKIAVFGSGWGGDVVADYLDENLGVVEVVRVIDSQNSDQYIQKSKWNNLRLVEMALKPYVGEVDVIVLASFATRTVMKCLCGRYPQQRFIQVDWPEEHLNGAMQHNVMILTEKKVRKSFDYRCWRRKLNGEKVIEPNCDRWLRMIDEGKWSRQMLRQELAPYRNKRIDTVILGSTRLWDREEQIAQALGWQTFVIDTKKILLKKVCQALNLAGVNCLRQC